MITGDLRKWLSLGTGVGIEVRGDDLLVTVARVRPKDVRVLGALEIPGFRERPAGEWGTEILKFLRERGCGHLACTVLLPRDEVIVRQLSLPGVGRKDMEAAIRFQIDSLHPYPEGEVAYAWAQIPNSAMVLVGIARRDVIDYYSTLLLEAGLRTATFTFSAAAFYSAFRTLANPPDAGFLVLQQEGEEWEAYGESPGRPVFSAIFDSSPERVLALASSELRLNPDIQPARLLELLPEPAQAPADWDLDRYAVSYATALAGACPWLALSLNLLPAERRSRSSRAVYAPTVGLGAILAILLTVLGVYGGITDKKYSATVNAEAAKYTAEAARIADLDAEMEALRARKALVRKFLRQTQDDMNSILDLTYLLAPPAYLTDLRIERNQVTVTGEAPEAAKLLEMLDASPLFHNSEFTSPISDAGGLQRFTVRLQREFPALGGGQ